MSNNIVLKRGLDIPLNGTADQKTSKKIVPNIVALTPSDFKGLVPRLLVREGDKVLAGSPIIANKLCTDILFTSPVSGTISQIVRGEKRKLLEVRIQADANQEYVNFGTQDVSKMNAAEIKDLLLKSGLWPAIIQRPYGVIADPNVEPKAIFVSAFSTAPLAASNEFALKDEFENIQTAINALSKLTNGGVHLSIKDSSYSGSPFHKLENVIQHRVSGPHPAGNVGIQISHISPIMKDEIVWTVSPTMLAAIGKLFTTGKYDLSRKVAITGPKAINPSYIDTVAGVSIKDLSQYYDNSKEELRFISGDALAGKNVGEDGFLSFYDNQITILSEGRDRELFGWAKPFRFAKFSSTRSYFSWLFPKKKYNLNTNTNGGPRAFMMSDVYEKVLPMDIFPIFLVKACLSGNIDDMEKYGIYEVLPEDLALCEYVDPSKNDIQDIISKGIDNMIKELS